MALALNTPPAVARAPAAARRPRRAAGVAAAPRHTHHDGEALRSRRAAGVVAAAARRAHLGDGEAPAPAAESRRAVLLSAAALAAAAASGGTGSARAACPTLTETPSGLKFCDVVVGSGDPPVAKSLIKVHYAGRLTSDSADATFDSSYDRGRPFAFSVGSGQVIKGWDLGILGGEGTGVPPMLPGGKRELEIPADLGYGSRGAGGGIIPPNATLFFTVELLGPVMSRKR